MNPRNFKCGCYDNPPTLADLRVRLTEIDYRIDICKNWGLSGATKEAVLMELGSQRNEIKMQMHELVEKL